MPILIKKSLILVEAQEINFTGKAGEEVKKWKYVFLTPENKLMTAYDDIGFYKNEVKLVSEGFNKVLAQDYIFTMREFNGITKLQLTSGQPNLGGIKPVAVKTDKTGH